MHVCRARHKGGLDLKDLPLPFWAEKAYIVGVVVYTQVENSYEPDEKDDDGTNFGRIRGKGDSGTFSLIHEALIESNQRLKEEEDYF